MYKRHGTSLLVSRNGAPDLVSTEAFSRVLTSVPYEYPIQYPIIKFGILMEHLESADEGITIAITEEEISSTSTAVVLPETLAQIEYFVASHRDHLNKSQKRQVGRLCKNAKLDLANDCGATKSELGEYLEENDNEFQKIAYKCKKCDERFYSESSWKKHLGKSQNESDDATSTRDSYTCDYCDEEFEKMKYKKMHMRNCEEAPDSSDTSENDSSENGDSDSSNSSSSEKRPALGKEIKTDRDRDRLSGRNPFADPNRLKDTGLHQGGGS